MIDVLLTPADLTRAAPLLPRAQCVILDILRATSTIVTALHNGAREVQLFPTLDAARAARTTAVGGSPTILAGEQNCLRPPDFDLGNSPRDMLTEKIGGSTLLLATTNGTRAANSARNAPRLFAASLLNASATADALLQNLDALDTLLVCAGTNNALALEDTLGAGAILFALLGNTYRADLPFTDSAWLAYHAFAAVRQRLPAALRLGQGALNLMDAGAGGGEDDITHCAQLDAMPILTPIDPLTLTAHRI